MAIQEKARWKNWAESLRQEMMTSLTAEVTKSVEAISTETATQKADSTLQSVRFWRDCQSGKSPNDFLVKSGFNVEFREDENSCVQEVTLKLNSTWMEILQRVLDRKSV